MMKQQLPCCQGLTLSVASCNLVHCKQGVERGWASEYRVEFSKARLDHDTWIDRQHPFYDSPKGPKDGTTYAESGRAVRAHAMMAALQQQISCSLLIPSYNSACFGQMRQFKWQKCT